MPGITVIRIATENAPFTMLAKSRARAPAIQHGHDIRKEHARFEPLAAIPKMTNIGSDSSLKNLVDFGHEANEKTIEIK